MNNKNLILKITPLLAVSVLLFSLFFVFAQETASLSEDTLELMASTGGDGFKEADLIKALNTKIDLQKDLKSENLLKVVETPEGRTLIASKPEIRARLTQEIEKDKTILSRYKETSKTWLKEEFGISANDAGLDSIKAYSSFGGFETTQGIIKNPGEMKKLGLSGTINEDGSLGLSNGAKVKLGSGGAFGGIRGGTVDFNSKIGLEKITIKGNNAIMDISGMPVDLKSAPGIEMQSGAGINAQKGVFASNAVSGGFSMAKNSDGSWKVQVKEGEVKFSERGLAPDNSDGTENLVPKYKFQGQGNFEFDSKGSLIQVGKGMTVSYDEYLKTKHLSDGSKQIFTQISTKIKANSDISWVEGGELKSTGTSVGITSDGKFKAKVAEGGDIVFSNVADEKNIEIEVTNPKGKAAIETETGTIAVLNGKVKYGGNSIASLKETVKITLPDGKTHTHAYFQEDSGDNAKISVTTAEGVEYSSQIVDWNKKTYKEIPAHAVKFENPGTTDEYLSINGKPVTLNGQKIERDEEGGELTTKVLANGDVKIYVGGDSIEVNPATGVAKNFRDNDLPETSVSKPSELVPGSKYYAASTYPGLKQSALASDKEYAIYDAQENKILIASRRDDGTVIINRVVDPATGLTDIRKPANQPVTNGPMLIESFKILESSSKPQDFTAQRNALSTSLGSFSTELTTETKVVETTKLPDGSLVYKTYDGKVYETFIIPSKKDMSPIYIDESGKPQEIMLGGKLTSSLTPYSANLMNSYKTQPVQTTTPSPTAAAASLEKPAETPSAPKVYDLSITERTRVQDESYKEGYRYLHKIDNIEYQVAGESKDPGIALQKSTMNAQVLIATFTKDELPKIDVNGDRIITSEEIFNARKNGLGRDLSGLDVRIIGGKVFEIPKGKTFLEIIAEQRQIESAQKSSRGLN